MSRPDVPYFPLKKSKPK